MIGPIRRIIDKTKNSPPCDTLGGCEIHILLGHVDDALIAEVSFIPAGELKRLVTNPYNGVAS